jgi:hypothetical protein
MSDDKIRRLNASPSRRRGFNLQRESRKLNGLPAVNVARPSGWGNPFYVAVFGLEGAVEQYRKYLRSSAALRRLAKKELRDKNLARWCRKGQPCHSDVLLEIANERRKNE